MIKGDQKEQSVDVDKVDKVDKLDKVDADYFTFESDVIDISIQQLWQVSCISLLRLPSINNVFFCSFRWGRHSKPNAFGHTCFWVPNQSRCARSRFNPIAQALLEFMESEVTCKILCVELATDVVARSQTIFAQQRYLSGPTMQPSSWGWKQNGIIWDHGSVSGRFLWNHSETWQLLVCIKFEAGTSIQIYIIIRYHKSNTSTQTYAISSGMHAGSSLSQAFSGHWTFCSDRNPESKWKASILHHRGRKSCRSNTSRIVRKPASA